MMSAKNSGQKTMNKIVDTRPAAARVVVNKRRLLYYIYPTHATLDLIIII